MMVENNNILFRYLLEDALGVLISEITLLSDCEENNVIGLNRKGEAPKWTVPAETVQRIKDIIRSNEAVLGLEDEDIENPSVLDGTLNTFFFSLDRQVKVFETFNIWAAGDPRSNELYRSEPVNARKLLKLFGDIAEELISAGVDEQYFQLSQEINDYEEIETEDVFITNFQSPTDIADLKERFELDRKTNLDIILANGAESGLTEWTVPKTAKEGDIVLFMCAKTSKDHIGHVCAQAKELGDEVLIQYAEEQRENYKKYAGNIVAVGTVMDNAYQLQDSGYENQYWKSPWYAVIDGVQILENPISISEFRSFITVSRTGAITNLDPAQWEKLSALILRDNPEIEFGKREHVLTETTFFAYNNQTVMRIEQLWDDWYVYDQGWRMISIENDPDLIKEIRKIESGDDDLSIISDEEALKLAAGITYEALEKLPANWAEMSYGEKLAWIPEYYKLSDLEGKQIGVPPYTPEDVAVAVISFLRGTDDSVAEAKYYQYMLQKIVMNYKGKWYVCTGNSWNTPDPEDDADLIQVIHLPESEYAGRGLKEITEDQALLLGLGKKREELEEIPSDWDERLHVAKVCWIPEYYCLYDDEADTRDYAPYMPKETRKKYLEYMAYVEELGRQGEMID